MGIVLKIVSKDYRVSQDCHMAYSPVPPSHTSNNSATTTTTATAANANANANANALREPVSRLSPCLKISYQVGSVLDIIKGNEARVPLLFHELRGLESRSEWMCNSPFPGQKLSFLSLPC